MNAPEREGVYLLHFSSPVSPNHTTQHYIGWAKNISARLAAHCAGSNRAARLTQVAHKLGIDIHLVRVWDGDRTLERRLKNRAEGPRLCPVCNPNANNLANY